MREKLILKHINRCFLLIVKFKYAREKVSKKNQGFLNIGKLL
jgi:hypothetical protein